MGAHFEALDEGVLLAPLVPGTPDMSNSIAVPLVLLFLKVLPLPLIIAYVDLEQLVLQLILVSSNNY